jgi:hypothetical protein
MQRLSGSEVWRADSRGASGPFRANAGGRISQGNPWARLFWPLRAADWNVQIAHLCWARDLDPFSIYNLPVGTQE